ncbi:MAG: dihydroorotate dehydrogenase-like protein [Bacteroidota bacterium]|nr:dihydroorotate dehydrogenase-like protein [Bacteroidota bacterium]
MAKLNVKYLGLSLKNPIIVSSSGLTDSVKKIIEAEKAGAGAVVLKSLFEEQLSFEAGQYQSNSDYPEADDYIRNYTKDNSIGQYLSLIEEAKAAVNIPVIASVNCVSAEDWLDFARKIETAGADALEINVFFLPTNKDQTSSQQEELYYELAEKLKQIIHIPLSFKLGRQFSNILNLVDRMYNRRVAGVVLFNRFYEPDIDIEELKLIPSDVFSSPSEIRQTLRWVGILSNSVEHIDIAASTGVHDGTSVIKLILAGASAVQVCSVLYKNGIGHISSMISELEIWMDQRGFKSIEDFKGKLSYRNIPDPSLYERSQFMKYFSSHH